MNSGKSEVRASPGTEGMKQGSGISASLGAIISSLATMGCCLPLGFAGALGAAGASAFVQKFRPWLLALSIFQGRRSEEESLRDRRCRGHTATCGGVPANGFFHAARARTSRHTHKREFRGVRRVLRQIHRRAPPDTAPFPDMINLSAGGLRSRATPAAQCGRFAPGTGGVGADASDGLAFTSS